ncbi:MAG: ribonucleotide reductase subunit alpha [Idiomarina sp.]|nr:ribonucleotide reductase subunit alpha [Idiomarina sp.]
MHISTYSDLIALAQQQPDPQRLLFVFAKAEMPPEPTKDQQKRFESGEGGYLIPVTCVDKLADEVTEFESLVAESKHTGVEWDMVFVAGMSGMGGMPPTPDQAEQPLKMMVEQIKAGTIANFVTFDKSGDAVSIV